MIGSENILRICLINGKENVYDACFNCDTKADLKRIKKEYNNLMYIGTGTIHKIDDVLQSGSNQYHFFIRK